MGATLSLIPELEQVVQHGSREKRVETLQRITALFLDGASRYNDEHVDLFDDVFGLLIEEIESKARAELSSHLGAGQQRAGQSAAHARQRRRYRRRRAGAQAGAAPAGGRSRRCRENQEPSPPAGHLGAPGAGRGGHRRAGAARRSRSRAPRRRQPRRPHFREGLLLAWSSAPRTTASWPRRSGCGLIFPRRCSANC